VANTLDVTHGIEAALALRPAARIDRCEDFPAGDFHRNVDAQSHHFAHRRRALVILILGAFLYEWRVALISVIAIPLSLVARPGAEISRCVGQHDGVADSPSPGSVVDDAIIDVENVVRGCASIAARVERARPQRHPRRIAEGVRPSGTRR
jgi:multidrug efflux pump subunit AcrB